MTKSFDKGKFIQCQLRVRYSNGHTIQEAIVPIKEGSDREDRISAIKTIENCKGATLYWIEDRYLNAITVRFQFNHRHELINL